MKQDGKFILLTKEEFKDWFNKQNITRKITLIQNHHTWSPSYKNFNGNNHFELLKNMENYHVKERKFAEIAQNITTFPDGLIAICRNINTAPAGIYGANSNGICIENLGNFDIGGDVMLQIHKDTIISLNAILCDYFKLEVSKDTVIYHAWYNSSTGKRDNDDAKKVDAYHKTCAGTNFFNGNSVQDAEKYFYPLIKQEIERMNKPIEIKVILPTLKKGSKGNDVKILQEKLKSLGYDVGIIDGDFGNRTLSAIIEFQKDNKLVADGIVGKLSWSALEVAKLKVVVSTVAKSNSYMHKDCKVVEVNPLDLKFIMGCKPANKVDAKNFATGGYQTWDSVYENGIKTNKLKDVPLGIIVDDGKVISNRQPHVGFGNIKYPAGTFIVHYDGSVENKSIVNIDNEKNVKFAISGCSILPKIRMNEEGFCLRKSLDGIMRDFSDIGRKTSRVCIGYNSKKKKVLIVGMPSANISTAQTIMKELGCDFADTMDSGGSAILVIDGKSFMTTTRQLFGFIGW